MIPPIAVRRDPSWKRPLDLLGAAVGLVLLSPVIAVVAVLILRQDGRPVFYRGVRVGRGGNEFRVFKFRSMVKNAEQVGGPSTSDDDPRLLPIGRTIRRYKLDELPQLINVLNGEMSLVGPRPQVVSAVAKYSDEEREVLSVKPGITDPASLAYSNEGEILAGAADPDAEYYRLIHPGKMRLSLEYVRTRSFAGDVSLIIRTALRVVSGNRTNPA